MVRVLLFCVSQMVWAAKEPTNVKATARYTPDSSIYDDCTGEFSHFVYDRLAGSADEAECIQKDEDDESSFAAYKEFCINGDWGRQEFSDVACNTPEDSQFVDKHNGECRDGRIAGCGSYDCEDVNGEVQCDYTPDKSVYETTSSTTTTGPPKATDVFAMKLHPTGKCTDDTDTMMFVESGGITKLADAQCDGSNKVKRWCEDGEVMVQEYSDSDCKTKEGDAKVTDECLPMGDSAAKISLDGCGNYMCSKDGSGRLVTCDYTKKNSSNKSSGTEMQGGLAMGMLAVAVLLAA